MENKRKGAILGPCPVCGTGFWSIAPDNEMLNSECCRNHWIKFVESISKGNEKEQDGE